MEKSKNHAHFPLGKWRKLVLIMKLKLFILLCCLQGVHANVLSQQRYDVSFQKETVLSVIDYLREHTGYEFFYLESNLQSAERVTVDMKQATLSEILDAVLKGQNLTYEIQDKVVIIRKGVDDEKEKKSVTVRGFVYDEKKLPLPGVTVRVPGVSLGTATNTQGWFSIDLPMLSGKLEFSFVGYESQQVDFNQSTDTLRVVLKEASQAIGEVVVTGIFNRAKESFTGAVRTVTREEIQTHYSRNLIQTLANLDPSLRIIQNNDIGSDPNALPELQLRGATTLRSTDDIRNNVSNYELNQPLFILDGFEVSLERVVDLNDSDIESITILKDASATALYGSRGANGVIVITSLRPKPGKITVSYQGEVNIEVPDLKSYDDLTSASEKLELERIYGLWDDESLKEQYQQLKDAVDAGLNYDWLDEPLHTGVGHRHILNLMGGTQNWRISLSLFYDSTVGVMKGSDRKNFNGSLSVDYTQGKWNVRQMVSIGKNSNADSPYGDYSMYVRMNRYWTPYDENGELIEEYSHPNLSYGLVENPMYDNEVGCWNKTKYTSLRSTTQVRFEISPSFQITGLFGVSWQDKNADTFTPPTHRYFAGEEVEQKGEYSRGEVEESSWETRLTLNYAKTFADKHMLTVGLSGEMSEEVSDNVSWSATGFLTSSLDHLSSSLGYPTVGGTYGAQSTIRRVAISSFVNYYYDSRYFVDLTYRLDGASSFGSNSRFSSFYALGLGWTIGKEEFVMEYLPFISSWSLRYSYGVSGNMAFSPEQALEVFNRDANYTYNGGVGVHMARFANPDLEQQNTFQHNVGMDMSLFNGRLGIVLNYYNKLTDNTLTDIYLPVSHGFEMISGNIGKIRNRGIEGSLNVKLLGTDKWNWDVTGSFSNNKQVIVELSEGFKNTLQYYDSSLSSADSYLRYREGHSMTAVYGLRTLGVDPLSGQRVFLTKDGEMTLFQDGDDLVYLGDTEPKINSSFSTTISYGNLSVAVGFNWVYGGVAENYTELNRRENLNLTYNVDRQILEDGWQKPGDHALYKRQGANAETTYACDMFIHKNNIFSCNSINIRYNLPRKWTKKLGMEMFSISTLLSDIFYFSTIHRERGISYPYSINPNISISCTF